MSLAKLGTKQHPAVIRVQSEERATELLSLCEDRGWIVIVGLEPDKPEDITDIERLLSPPTLAKTKTLGRNDPCSCGSGIKFKKCCLSSAASARP
jgi:SWIM/SEC-C metal-binding protein